MDLFVICCCLMVAAVAIDRALTVAPQRVFLRWVWIAVSLLWSVMAINWMTVVWQANLNTVANTLPMVLGWTRTWY